jgi:hypothetical protein
MALTRLWCSAELRRRGRDYLLVSLLVGFMAAAVLTCVAAARRTDSSYGRYVASQAVPDIELYGGGSGKPPAQVAAMVRALPGVESVGVYDTFFAAPVAPGVLPGQDCIVVAPMDDSWSRAVDRPVVLAGRLPNAAAADEVAINERAARLFHLRVGTRTATRSFSLAQGEQIQSGALRTPSYQGPAPTLRVVGIIRTRLDLVGASYAQQYFLASRAFSAANATRMFNFGALVDVRVRPGASARAVAAAVQARLPDSDTGEGTLLSTGAKGVRNGARVQAIALLLVGVAALLAALVAGAQAMGRTLDDANADQGTLAALGLGRWRRAGLTAVIFAPVAVGAAALAVIGAWFASRGFPTGSTRQLEVHPGPRFDPTVSAVSAAVVVVIVVAYAALRTAHRSLVRPRPARPPRPAIDRLVAVLPVTRATGTRWVVERPRDRARGAGATLGAACIAVIAVIAVVVYGASLGHLVRTPSAYGWTFDASAGGGNDHASVLELQDKVLHHPAVRAVARVAILGDTFAVNGRQVQAWSFTDVRGHIGPAVVTGRAPTVADEVLLGTATASSLHIPIGGTIRVSALHSGSRMLRVVGTGVLPTIETDRFDTGVVLDATTLRDIAGPAFAGGGGYENVVFRWAPGTDVPATVTQMRRDDIVPTIAAPPNDVAVLRLVRTYPLWLAAFVALLGFLATVHALVSNTRRRRPELGVLQAIGWTRREVARAIATQGAVIGCVAVVVGVPLGIALGLRVWQYHADVVGVAPAPQVAAGVLFGVAAIVVAGAWCSAATLAHVAARRGLASALRVE